jgi:hypothetical protein
MDDLKGTSGANSKALEPSTLHRLTGEIISRGGLNSRL